MSLLEVTQLRSAYGGVVALWDVSFEVAEGQVVTLGAHADDLHERERGQHTLEIGIFRQRLVEHFLLGRRQAFEVGLVFQVLEQQFTGSCPFSRRCLSVSPS